MKNQLLALCLMQFLCLPFCYTQEAYDYATFLETAVMHYENDDYEQSLDEINKVHRLDPNYLDAVVTKVDILLVAKKTLEAREFLESIFQEGLFPHKPELYILYGSILKDEEAYDKSKEVYDEGYSKFPKYTQLIFNKAILHYAADEIQEAVNLLKETIWLNPGASRAHYLLGVIAFENGQLAEGFLALLGYLAYTPNDDFAQNAILSMNVKLSQHYLEETEVVFSKTGDAFDELDVILRNQLPLDKKYKLQADVDENYTRYLQAVLEYSSMHKMEDGFFETIYVPFLKNIQDLEYTEAFTYYTLTEIEGNINRVIKRKSRVIDEFTENYILEGFWTDFATRYIDHFGEKMDVVIFTDNMIPNEISPVIDGKQDGFFKLVDSYGRIAAKGKYEHNIAQGPAQFYADEGYIIREVNFVDDEKVGEDKIFFPDGKIRSQLNWKDGKKDGIYQYSYPTGGTECTENYVDDISDGLLTCYYENGNKKTAMTFVDGKLEGDRSTYYADEKIKSEEKYTDGKLDGNYVFYGYDLQPLYSVMYEDGEVKESYKSYDRLGALTYENIIDGDDSIEKNYENGVLQEVYHFAGDNLKMVETYQYGIKVSEINIRNGELKSIIQFTKDTPEGTKMDARIRELKDYDGRKLNLRNYKRRKLEGTSTFYYINGEVSSTANFVDGSYEGAAEYFSETGILTRRYYFEDNELSGPYAYFYKDGSISSQFNYKVGKLNGPTYSNYETGELAVEGFYADDERTGKWFYYNRKGRIVSSDIYEKGQIIKSEWFDKKEEIDNTLNFVNNNDKVHLEFKDELVVIDFQLKNGVIEGPYTQSIENNQLLFESTYINGKKHGKATYYHPSGKLRHVANIAYGDYEGEALYYDQLGSLRTRTNFYEDEERGKEFRYYPTGEVFRSVNNLGGKWHGEVIYFNEAGDSLVKFNYLEDFIVSYQLKEKSGEFGKIINIDNKKYKLISTYSDGKTAMECQINKNNFVGGFKMFNEEGTPIIEQSYKNGKVDGTQKMYQKDGSIYSERNYKEGDLWGSQEYYTDKGQLAIKVQYKDDEIDGNYEIFENGKLIKTMFYEEGNLIEIK